MLARLRQKTGILAAVVAGLIVAGCQTAQSPSGSKVQAAAVSAPQTVAAIPYSAEARGHSALVVDGSGRVLHSENADAARYPASLTKMMTLYLLYEEIGAGRLSLNGSLEVSALAARQPPAKIGLKAGTSFPVRTAIQALAVKSANDVAVAVAENVAGSEAAFVARMNTKARSLGMRSTRFINPSGLPATAQVTTASDMARLGRALKTRFPQYAGYYRSRSFTYNGRTFKATNNLLGRVKGVDGLKTGYIGASGYNLVATGQRGGRRLYVVVMGGASEGARDREVTGLLEQYF